MRCLDCNEVLTGPTNDGVFILMHYLAGHKIELEENDQPTAPAGNNRVDQAIKQSVRAVDRIEEPGDFGRTIEPDEK